MKSLRRMLFSILIACIVTLSTTFVARAGGPYVITENPLTWLSGSGTPTATSTPDCRGGACKYMYQDTVNPATWRWAYTGANVYNWWVWRPNNGEAAARYWWRTYYSGLKDNWYVTVNQAANHGTWAYLGFSDYIPNTYGELRLSNQCVSGYWCGGLRVYWDDMEYDTSP